MVLTQVAAACFRTGLSVVPTPVKIEAGRRLLHEMANDPGNAGYWLAAFFTVDLMEALDERERDDLFSYVLQCLPEMELDDGFEFALEGVGSYLSASDARDLTLILTDLAVGHWASEGLHDWAARNLLSEMPRLPATSAHTAREAMDKAAERWASQPEAAARLSELRYSIWPLEDGDIPR